MDETTIFKVKVKPFAGVAVRLLNEVTSDPDQEWVLFALDDVAATFYDNERKWTQFETSRKFTLAQDVLSVAFQVRPPQCNTSVDALNYTRRFSTVVSKKHELLVFKDNNNLASLGIKNHGYVVMANDLLCRVDETTFNGLFEAVEEYNG